MSKKKNTIKINTQKVEQKLSQLNPYRSGALVPSKETDVLAWFRSRDNKNTNEKQRTFKKLHEAAEKGDSHAQNHLGFIYYTGTYVSSNYKEAIKWISQAAEQGNVIAQYNLGKIYYEGQCVTQDCDQAIKLFVKVVNQTKSEKQLIESAKFMLFVLLLYKAEIITYDDIVVINKLLHEIETAKEFMFSHYILLALADEKFFPSIRKLLKWVLPKIFFILGKTQVFVKVLENDLDNQGLLIEFLVLVLNHSKLAKANNLNAIIQES
jgi:hypothetical protein